MSRKRKREHAAVGHTAEEIKRLSKELSAKHKPGDLWVQDDRWVLFVEPIELPGREELALWSLLHSQMVGDDRVFQWIVMEEGDVLTKALSVFTLWNSHDHQRTRKFANEQREAVEAENVKLQEAVRVLGAAASQLAGALRLDAMVQDDGSSYGTTRVALDCYEQAVNTNPIAAAAVKGGE